MHFLPSLSDSLRLRRVRLIRILVFPYSVTYPLLMPSLFLSPQSRFIQLEQSNRSTSIDHRSNCFFPCLYRRSLNVRRHASNDLPNEISTFSWQKCRCRDGRMTYVNVKSTCRSTEQLSQEANDQISSAWIDETREILMNSLFSSWRNVGDQQCTLSRLICRKTCQECWKHALIGTSERKGVAPAKDFSYLSIVWPPQSLTYFAASGREGQTTSCHYEGKFGIADNISSARTLVDLSAD